MLLIGGSYSALPFAHIVKDLGHRLIVAGNDPTEPAHLMADESIPTDYSDVARAVPSLMDARPDYVVPSSNDRAYRTATLLANQRSLPGYDPVETERLISVKSGFRALGEAVGLRAPQSISQTVAEARLGQGRRVIVKPTDSFSGIGVTVVSKGGALNAAIEHAASASPSGNAIIEDHIEGSLHSHSMFVRNGECAVDFFVDEFCTQIPYQVNSSNHPSRVSSEVRDHIREETMKIVRQLHLVDGLLHTQFIVGVDGPWIIESMRRAPGDLYPSLIERSTGFDYSRAYVLPFLGIDDAPSVQKFTRDAPIARHTVDSRDGVNPLSIEYLGESVSWAFVPLLASGHRLKAAPSGKVGIAFLRFGSVDDLWRRTDRLIQLFAVGT